MGVIVTITEQSGNDLLDYPIRVEITDPQFFEECPNQKYIECYFQDGSWIPHHTELFDPANNKAVIWVKVPQIPANGTVKVFIKVNPTRTEDLSNPDAVFDLWDDFSGTELDTTKWEVEFRGNSYNIQDGILHIDDGDSGEAKSLFYSKRTVDKPIIVEMRARGSISRIGTLAVDKAQDFIRWHWITKDDHNKLEDFKYSDTTQSIESYEVGFTTYENEWHYFRTIFNGDYVKGYVRNEQRGTESTVEYTFGRSLGTYQVGFACYYTVMEVDWIRARKYTEPEPSVTVEYVQETVTYTDYFYWGMAKMLSGVIANFMQLPIKMEIYSGGNLIKTLSLKEISTITDAENKYIISVLKFEDDSSDSYQTDKQIVYVTDPNGNTRKLAESTYVFIKMAELPLLLGFEIRIPYEDTQVELS